MIAGFLLQLAALAILFGWLRGTWVRHLGALFIVAAVTYHGLGELFIHLIPGRNPYRRHLTPGQVENFFILISLAILLLTVVYIAVINRKTTAGPRVIEPADLADTKRFFDWRIVLTATIPLALLTVAGSGLTASSGYLGQDTYQSTSTSAGLAGQFLLTALALSGVALVLHFGRRWILPWLLVQSAVLAAVGQRNEVVVAAVLLIFVLAFCGLRWRKKQIAWGLVLVTLVGLVMTSTRAAEGRASFAAGEGVASRFGALASGVANVGSDQTREALRDTFGYRLDGNSFGAMELEALRDGYPPLGFTPLINDVRLAIPSALDPGKLDTDVADRSEKLYAQVHLGMPVTDILATQLGVTIGYFGIPSLFAAAVLLGLLFGLLDPWLQRRLSPARVLVGLGVLDAVAHYGRSWESWTITARGVLLLMIAMAVVRVIARTGAKAKSKPKRPIPLPADPERVR